MQEPKEPNDVQNDLPENGPVTASDDVSDSVAGDTTSEAKATEPWRDKVARMASEVAAREGCEIYDFDFIGGGSSRSLRIFIDKLSVTAADGSTTNKGVSIDDCSNVSRGLNLLLDVDDVIPGGAYNLEVSSPGLERPLRSATHFRRAAGSRAFVKTFESFADLNPELDESLRVKLGKSKQLEGVIVGIEGNDVETEAGHGNAVLVFDAETGGTVVRVKLPLGKVTKANTVFVFEVHDKPTAGKKPHPAAGKKNRN